MTERHAPYRVPTDEVAARWEESLQAAGNPRFEVQVLPGVDHGMRLTSGPHAGQLSPEYKQALGLWLEQVKGSSTGESESG